jgi:hypothetical protein
MLACGSLGYDPPSEVTGAMRRLDKRFKQRCLRDVETWLATLSREGGSHISVAYRGDAEEKEKLMWDSYPYPDLGELLIVLLDLGQGVRDFM